MGKLLLFVLLFVSLSLSAQNIDSLFSFEVDFSYLDMAEKTIYTDLQPFVNQTITYHFWQVGVFVFVVILLIFLKNNYYKNLIDLFAAAFNLNLSKQLHREIETSMAPYLLLLNLNAILIWTSISYLLLDYFGINTSVSGFKLIMYIAIFWTFVFFIKAKILTLLSKLFEFYDVYRQVSFSDLLLFKISGIVFAPFIILIPFFTFPRILIIILFLSLLFLLIYMYVRGFLIAKKYYDFSKYYFFLYLCALEIVPLVVSIKIIEQIMFS